MKPIKTLVTTLLIAGCVTTASFAQTEKPMAEKMSKKEMKKTERMKKDEMMKKEKMMKDEKMKKDDKKMNDKM